MKKTIFGISVFILIIGIVLLAFSFINFPRTMTEPYQVPKSSDIVNESFTVPTSTLQRTGILFEDDVVHIELEVTAGGNKDINFYIRNGTTEFIADTRVTTINKDWTVPSNGTYYFVYDNSFSFFTSKDVTTKVTRNWEETDYRYVTKHYPLLPYEFSYVGIVLLLAGVGIMILGFVRKDTPKPKS